LAQNRENFEFWGKFTPNGPGTVPLSDFYKILHEGVTGTKSFPKGTNPPEQFL